MVWVMMTKSTMRWTVRTYSDWDEQDLLSRRDAYQLTHPELFRTRAPIWQQGGPPAARPYSQRSAHPVADQRTAGCVEHGWLWRIGAAQGIDREPRTRCSPVRRGADILRKGDPAPQRYYALVLGHVAYHQVDDEMTTMRRNSRGEIEPPSTSGDGRGVIVVNRNETAGWHAWYSDDIFGYLTISDELHALLKSEKVPGLDFVQLPEAYQFLLRRTK